MIEMTMRLFCEGDNPHEAEVAVIQALRDLRNHKSERVVLAVMPQSSVYVPMAGKLS